MSLENDRKRIGSIISDICKRRIAKTGWIMKYGDKS